MGILQDERDRGTRPRCASNGSGGELPRLCVRCNSQTPRHVRLPYNFVLSGLPSERWEHLVACRFCVGLRCGTLFAHRSPGLGCCAVPHTCTLALSRRTCMMACIHVSVYCS